LSPRRGVPEEKVEVLRHSVNDFSVGFDVYGLESIAKIDISLPFPILPGGFGQREHLTGPELGAREWQQVRIIHNDGGDREDIREMGDVYNGGT
jgi:hypothetical protein